MTSVMAGTMLDLQAQTRVSVGQAAMLISWLYVGRLPGILVASVVLDRIPAELAISVSALLNAGLFALVPVFTDYTLMATVVALTGACIGFVCVGKSSSSQSPERPGYRGGSILAS